MSLLASTLLSILFLLILWVAVALEFGYHGKSKHRYITLLFAFILAIQSCSVVIQLAYLTSTNGPLFNTSPVATLLILLVERSFDRHIEFLLRLIPNFLYLLLLVVVTVCSFTYLGFLVFPSNSLETQQYFPTYGTAIWNMLMVLNGSNWPPPMMPAYDQNRAYAAFFFVYIVIADWCVLNLVLGFVYLFFRVERKSITERDMELDIRLLHRAFGVLDVNSSGCLSYEQMDRLLEEMYTYYEDTMRLPTADERYELILQLDQATEGFISRDTFLNVRERCFQGALRTLRGKVTKVSRFIAVESHHRRDSNNTQGRHSSVASNPTLSFSLPRVFSLTTTSSTTNPDAVRNPVLPMQVISHDQSSLAYQSEGGTTRSIDAGRELSDDFRQQRAMSEASVYGKLDTRIINYQLRLAAAAETTAALYPWYHYKHWHAEIAQLAMFADSFYFDLLSDSIIAINIIVCVSGGVGCTSPYGAFLVLSFLEAVIKFSAKGWYRYYRSYRNFIDGIITLVLFIVIVCQRAIDHSTEYCENFGIQALLLVRLFLFPRNIIASPYFAQFRQTHRLAISYAFKSASQFSFLFLLMGVLLFGFAAFGQQLFGGTIVKTGPLGEAISNSLYGQSGYWPLNFNDMPSGLVTLFILLHVNNMHVTASGFVASVGQSAEIFFAIWYAVGVLFLLNILTAAIINQFISYLESLRAQRIIKDAENDQLITAEESAKLSDNPIIAGPPASSRSQHSAAVESLRQDSVAESVASDSSALHQHQLKYGDISGLSSADICIATAPITSESLTGNNESQPMSGTSPMMASQIGSMRETFSKSLQRDPLQSFPQSIYASSRRRESLAQLIEANTPSSFRTSPQIGKRKSLLSSALNESLLPAEQVHSPLIHGQQSYSSGATTHNYGSTLSTAFTQARDNALQSEAARIAQHRPLSEPLLPPIATSTPISTGPQNRILGGTERASIQGQLLLHLHKEETAEESGAVALMDDLVDAGLGDATALGPEEKALAQEIEDTMEIRSSLNKKDCPIHARKSILSPTMQRDENVRSLLSDGQDPIMVSVALDTHNDVLGRMHYDRGSKDSDIHIQQQPSHVPQPAASSDRPLRDWVDWMYGEMPGRISSFRFSPLERAAVLVQFARDGQQKILHPSPRALICYRLRSRLATMFRAVAAIFAILHFFSRPYWTYGKSNWADGSVYPMSGIYFMSPATEAAVRLPLLLTMMIGVGLEIGYKEALDYNWFRPSSLWNVSLSRKFRLVLFLFLFITSWILVGVLGDSHRIEHDVTVQRWVCATTLGSVVFVLWFNRRSLQKLLVILRIIPRMSILLIFFFLVILAFAGCGPFIFHSGKDDGAAGDDMYFDNFPDAAWYIFIAITSSSFPGQIMPAYQRHREMAIYFIAFIGLGAFGLLNLLVVTVLIEFQKAGQIAADTLRANRRILLMKAFTLLADPATGIVARADVIALLDELRNHYTDFTRAGIPPGDARHLLVDILDVDGDGAISLHDFLFLLDVVRIRIEVQQPMIPISSGTGTDDSSSSTSRFTRVWCTLFRASQSFAKSRKVDVIADCFIAFLVALSLCLNHHDLYVNSYSSRVIMTTVAVLLTTHMLLKRCIVGRKETWRSFRNRFDVLLSVLLLLAVIGDAAHHHHHHGDTEASDSGDLTVTGWTILGRVALMVKLVSTPRCLRLVLLLIYRDKLKQVVANRSSASTIPEEQPSPQQSQGSRATMSSQDKAQLRNLRKLLRYISQLGRLMRRVFAKIFTLGIVFLCAGYLFASLGLFIFGGAISYTENSSAFLASTYYQNNFYTINFNDFASACITLFCCLKVSDFDVIASGFTSTVSVSGARFYFAAWYIIGVLLLLNVVKSFFLGEFVALFIDPSDLKDADAAQQELVNTGTGSKGDKQRAQQQRNDHQQLRQNVQRSLSLRSNPSFSQLDLDDDGSRRSIQKNASFRHDPILGSGSLPSAGCGPGGSMSHKAVSNSVSIALSGELESEQKGPANSVDSQDDEGRLSEFRLTEHRFVLGMRPPTVAAPSSGLPLDNDDTLLMSEPHTRRRSQPPPPTSMTSPQRQLHAQFRAKLAASKNLDVDETKELERRLAQLASQGNDNAASSDTMN